jgi:AraC-like DNA-binding protein
VARHLLRARDLVDARYFEALTVADMAAAANMSPSHFSRRFSVTFGEPPHQYLLTRRLERAAALLRTSDWPVTDICFAVGWNSVGSFTTSFRRVFGLTPLGYRSSFPPAESWLRIPRCVAQAYGRPQNRTFREVGAATVPLQLAQLVAKGAGGTLFLQTNDLQASYDELSQRGITFNDPPTPQAYGIDTSFRDPSGNNIRLTQVLEFDPTRS